MHVPFFVGIQLFANCLLGLFAKVNRRMSSVTFLATCCFAAISGEDRGAVFRWRRPNPRETLFCNEPTSVRLTFVTPTIKRVTEIAGRVFGLRRISSGLSRACPSSSSVVHGRQRKPTPGLGVLDSLLLASSPTTPRLPELHVRNSSEERRRFWCLRVVLVGAERWSMAVNFVRRYANLVVNVPPKKARFGDFEDC